MGWVRLSDDFTEHPKFLEVGPLAGWLWVSALAYSNRNRTDGMIHRAVLPRLANFDGIGVYLGNFAGDDVKVDELVRHLVDVGLFDQAPGGWMIHDYADYQLTAEQIEQRSEAKRRAGRAGGLASVAARGGDSASHDQAPVPSGAQAEGQAGASPDAQAELKPNPKSQSPNHLSSISGDTQEGAPQVVDDEVWTQYARLRARSLHGTPGEVKNFDRWAPTAIARAKAEHSDTAARWLSDFDVTPREVAAALVDGKAGHTWTRRQNVG